MSKLLNLLYRLYKITLSPIFSQLFGRGCRFNPTCSFYAKESIRRHGILKGSLFVLRRLSKCHPYTTADSFFDPVP